MNYYRFAKRLSHCRQTDRIKIGEWYKNGRTNARIDLEDRMDCYGLDYSGSE
jgi:hypothetical protein